MNNPFGISYCPCCGTYLQASPKVSKSEPDGNGFCYLGMYKNLTCGSDIDFFYQPFARRYFFSTPEFYRSPYEIHQEWDCEYCVDCGSNLPEPLLDLWLETVKEKFGVEKLLPLEKMLPLLSEEFQTSLWWENRCF